MIKSRKHLFELYVLLFLSITIGSLKNSEASFYISDNIIGNDSIENIDINEVRQKTTAKRVISSQVISNNVSDISLRVNNVEYFYLKNNQTYNNENFLFFKAENNQVVAEVRIYPEKEGIAIPGLRIINSPDYDIIDTLLFINNNHYRSRIRFNNLAKAEYPVLLISYLNSNSQITNKEIKLAPYFIPTLQYDDSSVELFRGEEKTIEISGTNLFSVELYPEWTKHNSLDYKLIRHGNNLRLLVRANNTGDISLPLEIKTISPVINESNEVSNYIETITLKFNVKPSRLQFLNTDKNVVYFEPDRRKSEEIRLDYHPSFELRKNYRIEDKQEQGGTFIAEIFIKSITSDNKVLADIRTYDLHRMSDGYLYIKDGNKTVFMTNFNIVNRPEITKIEILREGGDWTTSLNVFPGEKFEVKVEGNGLLDASITFDGCIQKKDSIRQSDRILFYEISVPINIPRRKIMIFLNQAISQHELLVREYQRPADLDFVKINYGTRNYEITSSHFNQPVFYNQTIRDVNIIFDADKIDNNRLNGKQYLTIEVRILDENNRLLDFQTISNIVVCPGENSPRYAFYGETDCKQQTIRLNDYLIRKTYNLDAFSQIIITVKHSENHHSSGAKSQKATIFAERKYSFDIMVSFPAGLLVKEFSQSGIGNLSGISTSVLAEISFYDPKRIGTKRPYKFGAGFIALNAFNFGESANIKRDIGIVGIAVIEPIRGSAKFSVPIYLGIGYLLKENDFFAIFGPGIRLHF
ncbi:MAG: hypothetical protein KGZ97_02325 [Bacteroidetes bacterium]|nr:hypothetical protein [Bacteroidota bacterium]